MYVNSTSYVRNRITIGSLRRQIVVLNRFVLTAPILDLESYKHPRFIPCQRSNGCLFSPHSFLRSARMRLAPVLEIASVFGSVLKFELGI